MNNRIAIAALAALVAAGSLLGAFAQPALADDHPHHDQHHHAYYNGHPAWNNGHHAGWNNGHQAAGWNGHRTGWYNGKYYGKTAGNGNGTWVNGKHYPAGSAVAAHRHYRHPELSARR